MPSGGGGGGGGGGKATFSGVRIIVGYGLAIPPIEEDRAAVELDMTRRGYGPEVVSKALEIADATEAIVVSNFKSGFDRLDAVRAKYGNEPWFKYVHGNVTFFMLEQPEATVREQGPMLLRGILPQLRSNAGVARLEHAAALDTGSRRYRRAN